MTTEQWALCWSKVQNCLHVEPMDRMLAFNRQAYTNNTAGDYRLIAIGDKKLMEEVADSMRGTLARREFDLSEPV